MKLCVLILMGFLLGCSIPLTKKGAEVILVATGQREACQFINTVTGSMDMGASTGHDAESAMNEARNKAARIGANAIYILNIDSDSLVTTVVAEALYCK